MSLLSSLMLSATAGAMPEMRQTGQLEEIRVTAERRESSLQDTPISISAFSSERLEMEGISGLQDISNRVPSLTIEPFPINGGTLRVFVRGIGISDAQLTQDPPVAIYVDGVYLARASGTAMDVIDLERIEVLRGPQGTLYGRNTTGGAINFISRRPDTENRTVEQRVSVGNRDLQSSRTSINLPISQNAALRLVYQQWSKSGFVENTGPGEDFGDRDEQALKFDFAWAPGEHLDVQYHYQKTELEYVNYLFQAVTPPDPNGNKGQAESIKETAQANTVYGEHILDSLATGMPMQASESESEGHSIQLSWSFENSELRYTAARRELTDISYSDLGGGMGSTEYRLDTGYYDGPSAFNANDGPTPDVRPRIDQRQLSHELHFLGELADAQLQYQLGLYYFEERGVEDNTPLHHQLSSPVDGARNTRIVNFVSQLNRIQNDAEAVFGELSWVPDWLDKQLRVTLGARHSRDRRDAEKYQRDEIYIETAPTIGGTQVLAMSELAEDAVLGPLLTPVLYQAGFPGDRRFDVTAGREFKDDSFSGLLEYQFEQPAMVYLKMVEAYKSGGFNTRDPQRRGDEGPASDGIDYGVGFEDGFREEKARSLELGLKSEWFQQRLRVNADIFRTDFDDMQMNFLLEGTVADTKVLNAGKAQMSGFEADLTWQASAGLVVHFDYAYLDADVKKVIDTFGNDVTSRFAFSSAPRHSYVASLDWDIWQGQQARLHLNINTSYMDERLGGGDILNAYTIMEAYQLWNARLLLDGVAVGKTLWQLALWGKNLSDEEYELYAIDNLPQADRAVIWGEPVSYGVDLSVRF